MKKRLSLLSFSLVLLTLSLLNILTNNRESYAVGDPCKVCDAYGSCGSSGISPCGSALNECTSDSDCVGSPPPPIIIDPNRDCTTCDTFSGICEFNGEPCNRYTCNPGHSCSAQPTPQIPNYGDCPPNNGFPWCRQTNPEWANVTISACDDPLRAHACGQSVVTAVWCKYSDGLCDVRAEIAAGNFTDGNHNLCYTGTDDLYQLMSRSQYAGDYEINRVQPTGNSTSLSRDQLIQYLQDGNVIIASGSFQPQGATDSVAHHTLITGVDESGRLIFNDPYFNCDNTGSNRICTDRLEDQMQYINIVDAIIVSPPQ